MLSKLPQLLVFLLITTLGLAQTLIYWRFGRNFARWPRVPAEITHSRLLNQLIDGRSVVEAIVTFKYEVDGREYSSKTPALRSYNLFPSVKYESGLVEKYRPGDVVTARFHPLQPSIAYLERAPISWSSTLLLPAWIALGFAVLYGINNGYFTRLWDFLVLQNDLLIMESESRRQ
ncbi:DUF3592 domain-containing protein [Microbulbifer flavimaris]|uniref:DUF3592 domain-containing protein n=1 Tax=Microbulbifer flavimaris TaxID=1781068 RepID=A0ABX4HYW8_9GAMM|nr:MULTISPECIES: DUF3592 domain-containing protein [Microbulbifer]KUJ83136.1 hypothetical protein AVO43_11415 [Microbulbifer sp. ZGT114]PCO05324.1 DUF3592 domain-containing protein [Microbulbifer flavimaris]